MLSKKVKIIRRIIVLKEPYEDGNSVFIDENEYSELSSRSYEEYEKEINEFLSKMDSHHVKKITVGTDIAVIEYV